MNLIVWSFTLKLVLQACYEYHLTWAWVPHIVWEFQSVWRVVTLCSDESRRFVVCCFRWYFTHAEWHCAVCDVIMSAVVPMVPVRWLTLSVVKTLCDSVSHHSPLTVMACVLQVLVSRGWPQVLESAWQKFPFLRPRKSFRPNRALKVLTVDKRGSWESLNFRSSYNLYHDVKLLQSVLNSTI